MSYTPSLAISPCPNDTAMFYALLHNKISSPYTNFNPTFLDIEQLNQAAEQQAFDVMKLSYTQYLHISDKYQILRAGSALGYKNGPLLISKRKIYPDEVPYLKIAIPGKATTANLLLSIAYPDANNRHVYLFSDIEEVVLSDEADAGLLIHETRFSYQARGLQKIMDLGEYWEEQTNLPLPLGAIVIKRDLDNNLKQQINQLIADSVRYGLSHIDEAMPFIQAHAQDLNPDTCRRHIQLYVNDFSVDLGDTGTKAVNTLFERAVKAGYAQPAVEPIYIQA